MPSLNRNPWKNGPQASGWEKLAPPSHPARNMAGSWSPEKDVQVPKQTFLVRPTHLWLYLLPLLPAGPQGHPGPEETLQAAQNSQSLRGWAMCAFPLEEMSPPCQLHSHFRSPPLLPLLSIGDPPSPRSHVPRASPVTHLNCTVVDLEPSLWMDKGQNHPYLARGSPMPCPVLACGKNSV